MAASTSPACKRFGIQSGEPQWMMVARIAERHIGVLIAVLFVPLNGALAVLLLASYCVRVFAVEAIYHRYFSHRAFRCGRAMQCLLAILGTQCGQRGPLWWAAKHRLHHRVTDTPADPHSPQTHSFFHAHLGWFAARAHGATDLSDVPDFAAHVELRCLNAFYLVPFYGAAALLFAAGHYGWLGLRIDGVSALLWGFYVPSFLQIHGIALVNSIGHLPRFPGGYRRFDTADSSMNRPLLALFTLGSGWHNNHHRYAAVGRAGFAWYEVDPCYYVLRLLNALGVIRDLRWRVPADILAEGGLGRAGNASAG